MGYVNIVWDNVGEEKTLLIHIIEIIGNFSIHYKHDILCSRSGVIKVRDRINNYIEKFVKTDYRIHCPILDKDNNHEDWKKFRLKQRIDVELIKNG